MFVLFLKNEGDLIDHVVIWQITISVFSVLFKS